ncbi:glycosyltransferase family 2 protein [Fundidesulfovibrio terrae]|uniref:glycosyltransferase family 2 protein n=1 Tax=Fundidesulfovibrio terrae TaxID=2922866 RepID=UPI001FB01440|nr:glycosyltransferase family 2 protein [Fundidesulfovibrio terrae]
MTEPSHDYPGFFPAFEPDALARLAGPLPTWALSTESSWQQWGLAEGIVRGAPGDQVLMSAAAGLLSWAWQQRPLSAPTLALLLTLDGAAPFLSPDLRQYLQGLKKRLRPPASSDAWEALKAVGSPEDVAAFLELSAAGPHAAALLGEAWEHLVRLSDRDRAASIISSGAGDPVLKERLLAELDLHHRLPGRALSHPAFAPWSGYRAGLEAFRAGNGPDAFRIWSPLLAAMPWNVNLTLLAHDARFLPVPGPLPSPRTAILTYCWNKAELIAQTLESVFASDIGDNPVFVLDNGSTDATPDTLRAARGRFGPERLTVVTLPVNVGAPAARNWLLSLPEVRACRFAAFLDDDVILPRDWLSKLLHAAGRHPECGVVGCAIRDHEHPHRLQSADYHLLHRLPGEAGQEPGERLRVFMNCTGTLDSGLFAYERPCLSVSGCCHMLDLSLLDGVGGFDVRYTPTQFDDLDRDIRCFLAGRPCLYTGGLAIDHVQRSSLRQASSPAQVAHILGNKIKLEAKYDDKAVDAMVAKNFEMAWRDLLEKQAKLRG